MKKLFQKILFLLFVVSSFILVLFLLLRITGHQIYFLHSSSMTPAYKYQSVIIADTRIPANKIVPGNVVIYRTSTGMLVMHRCISVDRSGLAIIKGDRNRSQAKINLHTDLVGKVVCALPS